MHIGIAIKFFILISLEIFEIFNLIMILSKMVDMNRCDSC